MTGYRLSHGLSDLSELSDFVMGNVERVRERERGDEKKGRRLKKERGG